MEQFIQNVVEENVLNSLPVAVGDNVYRIWTVNGKKVVGTFEVVGYSVNKKGCYVSVKSRENNIRQWKVSEFGKTIFTSYEEAKSFTLPLCIRMYAGVKFNRPVDLDEDSISVGSYTMVMNGKEVQFDFEEFCGGVYKEDPCIVAIEQRNLLYDVFPEVKNITKEMLENITEIKEFNIDIESSSELRPAELDFPYDLCPISLEYITFVLPYDKWRTIQVPTEVIKTAKF